MAKKLGRGRIYKNIAETIGDTPIIHLDMLAKKQRVKANLLAKLIVSIAITSSMLLGSLNITLAETKSRVIPLNQLKSIVSATKASGWVAFKDHSGGQNLYFSHLVSWRCGMKEVRYSINSKDLDQVFPLAKCNPQIPNNVPDDPKWILLILERGTAKTVAVQVLFEDDTLSEMAVYEPCDDVGDQACTWLVE